MSTAELDFVGTPFNPLAFTNPVTAPAPLTTPSTAALVRELRNTLVQAHEQAIRAQDALQRKVLHLLRPVRTIVDSESRFKPLGRTKVTDLNATALAKLATGDSATVFGPDYDQYEANPDIRLSGTALTAVTNLTRDGLTAHTTGNLTEAIAQATEVLALYLGLHLCFADATLVRQIPAVTATATTFALKVTAVDLVPRPHVQVNAEIPGVGVLGGITVTVREKPGVPVGPERGGVAARWLGRVAHSGERVALSEFQLAHFCRGDQGLALGPEFAHYTGRKATRPPDGGLLLVDRIVTITGRRGVLDRGSDTTEYYSPADAWYYQDTANASMPNCVYMETSLQAALMLGYYLGPTLNLPKDETVSLRNLGGTATVLREVDLRDKTLTQHSELLSTSPMPGATLQNFAYTTMIDGDPFYSGETLFGYFNDTAMANQNGLDAGKFVPNWLDQQSPKPVTRTIDIAARRTDPAAKLVSRDHLALLDDVQVVDNGGTHGLGYLRATRRIDPTDWVFKRHFHYDPVIPGSFGVEAIVQAMQEWLLDTGLGADLRDPGFILPVGLPFTWKYRGQFLPTDGEYVLEAHIKSVERKPGRIRVVADASMWKPGLRIYELTDIGVELREEGAQPW